MDAALSGRKTGYLANNGMVTLNMILVLSLISSYATGYDGSMMSTNFPDLSVNRPRLILCSQMDCRHLTPGKLSSTILARARLRY